MSDIFNLGDLWDRTRDFSQTAVIDLRAPGEPRRHSHADIDAQSRAVARLLRARFEPGERIGILSGNRAEYLAAYSGITRAGLIAVPMNQKAPADLAAYVISDANIRLVFTDAGQRAKIPAGTPRIDFDDGGPEGYAALLQPGPFETFRPDASHVAEILYTSGSTGRPKGVPLTHAGQLWMARRRRGPAETALPHVNIIAQPLFHMAGLLIAKRTLQQHEQVVILPAFDAREYLQVAARYGVTQIHAVPTVLARLIKDREFFSSLDLSRVRAISMGSAPMTANLFEKVRSAFPLAAVSHGYGSTEAGGGVFGPHPDGLPTPPVGLGVPFPGIDVKLADGPSADEGVMLLRSPGVMTHYLNLPAQTAKVFRDGWYVTGDVLRRDENGFYFFVGRSDDMFVCAGENIYPSDVEKTLERHPGIHQACVLPLPDEERGQIPVAFIVPAHGAQIGAADVRAFALEHGPSYQYPRRIAFLPDLPWAGTNKIDRHALARQAAQLEQSQSWAQ
jgi:acyl-CoA synthetase (AMP-forming)/AMP-acid ligase II